jgi:hypothetical protein
LIRARDAAHDPDSPLLITAPGYGTVADHAAVSPGDVMTGISKAGLTRPHAGS